MSPSREKIARWFEYAFGRQQKSDSSYFEEWVDRFKYPDVAWSRSDLKRRMALKKYFPKTFKGLKLTDNINNPELLGKYVTWKE